jgi:hypothetical protein
MRILLTIHWHFNAVHKVYSLSASDIDWYRDAACTLRLPAFLAVDLDHHSAWGGHPLVKLESQGNSIRESKSVDCNSQLGSTTWRGNIHLDQLLLQQHTTSATFDFAAWTAGLAQHSAWRSWPGGSSPGFRGCVATPIPLNQTPPPSQSLKKDNDSESVHNKSLCASVYGAIHIEAIACSPFSCYVGCNWPCWLENLNEKDYLSWVRGWSGASVRGKPEILHLIHTSDLCPVSSESGSHHNYCGAL